MLCTNVPVQIGIGKGRPPRGVAQDNSCVRGAALTKIIERRLILIAGFACLVLASVQILAGGQPGVSETVFNRRFIPTIKPTMTYEQIVNMAGAPGLKVGENNRTSPATVQYRWKGGRDSILTVNFINGKMIDATVLAPNGHTYAIRKSGEVVDTTK